MALPCLLTTYRHGAPSIIAVYSIQLDLHVIDKQLGL